MDPKYLEKDASFESSYAKFTPKSAAFSCYLLKIAASERKSVSDLETSAVNLADTSESVVPTLAKKKKQNFYIRCKKLQSAIDWYYTQKKYRVSPKFIGERRQGAVTKGRLNGTTIAIKTMESLTFNNPQIIKEIASLRMAAHENVVTFLGVCIKPPMHVHVLMELVYGFNLKEVVMKQHLKEEFLTRKEDKHRVCYQLTKAVAYLYGHSFQFKHRDLKPLNVLINSHTKVVKLCNFGFAQMNVNFSKLESTAVKLRKVGTYWYMAPEVFFKKKLISTASDVWSLCATISEVYLEIPI